MTEDSNAKQADVDGSTGSLGSTARPKWHEFDEDCVCGNPTGQNDECERCRLVHRLMNAERNLAATRSAGADLAEIPISRRELTKLSAAATIKAYNAVSKRESSQWMKVSYRLQTAAGILFDMEEANKQAVPDLHGAG